ncbi:MAG: tetratricopeptide repeat protein [Calditrichaeota bacterium]|nr:tetratricopeptide repeat protein [Calditrichota bacterium]
MKKLIISSMMFMVFIALLACGSNKEATLKETRSPEEIIQAGDMLFAQGKYEQALDTYQRLLIFYPTSDLDVDAKLKIAECYNKLEKYEKQMDVLLQLLKENLIPERVPAIYIQLGKFYEQAALFNPGTSGNDTLDYQKAIEYYEKAIKYKDSKDKEAKTQALYRKALVEAKLGQLDEAIKNYQEIVDKNPESPFAVLAQIKMQDPQNTAELSTFSDSLEVYKSRLGKPATPEKSEATPEVEESQKVPAFEEYLKESTETEESPADTSKTEIPAEPDTLKK